MDRCAGRVALVTGASRGIGAAIAIRLAAEGATVAVTARTLEAGTGGEEGSLLETVAAIEAVGGRAHAVVADLTVQADVAAVVPDVEDALGPIDILVNNAGVGHYKALEELDLDWARAVMALDYHAPMELSVAVAPGMRERREGWILNISSVVGKQVGTAPFDTVRPMEKIGWHYGAAKAALDRMTVGLAAELYADGIAVNAMYPVAGVLTPAFARVAATVTMRPGLIEPVEQMAEAALALVTGDPRVLTGRVVSSGEILAELGEPVRTLDGTATLEP
jgi:NAD(P)-dependent dehydrogenase (short-subunit alcohol dehydrogenase family)